MLKHITEQMYIYIFIVTKQVYVVQSIAQHLSLSTISAAFVFNFISQSSLNILRCHLITVSGCTITKLSFQLFCIPFDKLNKVLSVSMTTYLLFDLLYISNCFLRNIFSN